MTSSQQHSGLIQGVISETGFSPHKLVVLWSLTLSLSQHAFRILCSVQQSQSPYASWLWRVFSRVSELGLAIGVLECLGSRSLVEQIGSER